MLQKRPVGRVQPSMHSADSLKIVSKVWELYNKAPPDGRTALRPSRPHRLTGRLTVSVFCDD